jgi:hypothetical protein
MINRIFSVIEKIFSMAEKIFSATKTLVAIMENSCSLTTTKATVLEPVRELRYAALRAMPWQMQGCATQAMW